jgi:GMP synthase-like glutamine amidotransferase
MRPVAVFRFSRTEGPGRFGEYLQARGIPVRVIALDRGEAVPEAPREFAGIGLMGGPMSANDPLPWVEPLLGLLRSAVREGTPVIGHCLGGQLLARALGGTVTRAAVPEIGWHPVREAEPGAARAWTGTPHFTAFQWHFDTFSLPPGARRLLTGDACVQQGYVVDERHLGLQCHIEMTRELVAQWCRDGAGEIERHAGPTVQSTAAILADLDARLGLLSAVADRVYDRWTAHVRQLA